MKDQEKRIELRRDYIKRCYLNRRGSVPEMVRNAANSVFMTERTIYYDLRALKYSGQF